MNPANTISRWTAVIAVVIAAFNAHADVVHYILDEVTLTDGQQIAGTFDWTFTVDDFEGGNGVFTALDIPYTIYSFADGTLNMDIQSNSIEISGNGNYHDVGLDITLVLSPPLSSDQPAPLDLGLSFFECCGNGFKDQFFSGGSVLPIIPPVGDANRDAVVNILDLSALSGNWQATAAGWTVGDFNDDNIVNILDLASLSGNWGYGEAGAPLSFGPSANTGSVPEPGTLALLLLGGTALLRRRRRR